MPGIKNASRPGFAARCAGTLGLVLLALAAAVGLPGCSVLLATAVPFPSDTPTLTLTPTRTIQWFPSTVTPTPGAARLALEPTPNQRLALGEVLLKDNFTDSSAWQIYDSAGGSARLGKNVLSLAAPELSANLVSLRRGALPQNLYLEVTSSTSLCRAKDTYGVVFRSDGATSHYRLIVSCDGRLRVERWRASDVAVVEDWHPSGQIPQSGPQVLRLGIWLVGSEMRFFIDDVYQFAARDPLLDGTQVGVFLRSTGANAMSVSFSDLSVRAIQGYVPSPVPSPTPDISRTPTRMPTKP